MWLSCRRIQEGLEEGSIHTLQHSVTEGSWCEFGESPCFEKVGSFRAAWAIGFWPKRFAHPTHVIPCFRIVGNILTNTSSRNHATKLFRVNGPFKLLTWKMYLPVGPFHELIAVAGPWAMVTDELVHLPACSLIQSCFLLIWVPHVPNGNLHPAHSIQHVVLVNTALSSKWHRSTTIRIT